MCGNLCSSCTITRIDTSSVKTNPKPIQKINIFKHFGRRKTQPQMKESDEEENVFEPVEYNRHLWKVTLLESYQNSINQNIR